jgi:hypothetical protein
VEVLPRIETERRDTRARALFIGVDTLHTYDDYLLKMSGKIGTSMKIEMPTDPNSADLAQ